MAIELYEHERQELQYLCNFLYTIDPSQTNIKRRLDARIRDGGDCWKMFNALVSNAIMEDRQRGEDEPERFTKALKYRAGMMLRLLNELSPLYNEKRDGLKWLIHERPNAIRTYDSGTPPEASLIKFTGEQVRAVVMASGETPAQFAIRCGCNRSQIVRYMQGGLPYRMNGRVRSVILLLAREYGIYK